MGVFNITFPSLRVALTGSAAALLAGCASSGVSKAPAATASPVRSPALAAFSDPPRSAAPSTFWYWVSDDIAKEGLTKDLEVMRRIGIAEAYIGNVDTNPDNRGPVASLSPEWWEALRYAMEEAARLEVNIGMFNSPGWSQSGGPWVKPEQSMRSLTVQEYRVTGSHDMPTRLVAADPGFQPVRLLAYPEGAGTANLARGARVMQGGRMLANLADGRLDTTEIIELPASGTATPVVLELQLSASRTVRTLQIFPGPDAFYAEMDLLAPDEAGKWRSIEQFTVDRRVTRVQLGPMNDGPITIRIPATASDRFRLEVRRGPDSNPIRLADIALREAPLIERYVEKQLGKMWQTPEPDYDAYLWPVEGAQDDPQFAVPEEKVLDLTDRLLSDGSIDWQPPHGNWRLAWFGMVPTGAENGPSTPAATGLEIDKMSAVHLRSHFESYVGRARAALSPQAKANFTLVIADSYEQGAQNWTDDMARRFVERFGYDPVPYLPTLSGVIIGSTDESDRFLWDLRKLVSEVISREYVGGLRKLSNDAGMQLWLENYGHWGFPGEFLQYGGQSDQVGAEFWVNPEYRGDIEIPAAVSAARVYDKPRVSAEAFTNDETAGHWSLAPWSLKRLGDKATAQGINHFVLHVNIHQPDDRLAGVNSWFGSEFNRGNTWYPEAKAWIDYLRRTHGVLQAGVPQAEVLYFIGEDTPKMSGLANPEPPVGVAFDYVNTEALAKLVTIRDGRWVLPNGTSYAILAMPPSETMTPQLLEVLAGHVAAGGQMFGSAPLRSPSLADSAAADARVRAGAAELWGDCGLAGSTSAAFGGGQVHCAGTLATIFATQGIRPQVSGIDYASIRWTQVSTAREDVFFLANQTDQAVTIDPVLKSGYPALQLWDPVSGSRSALAAVQDDGILMAGPISLEAFQSVLLVASAETAPGLPQYGPVSPTKLLADLNHDWDVTFDPALGGPASIRFARLQDWTDHVEPGVKYYSGRATYRKTVSLDRLPANAKVWLDLGVARDIALVTVNGREVGTVWTAPWRIDVSDALQKGENRIEVTIINTWANRIIGDLKAEAGASRFTYPTNPHVTAQSPLNPSGLLGPVRLVVRVEE
ncbi:glycosyl hydrolase [Erythrobacter sp.]|uniref:glycosyl hydrolase n=1 Tax=Erythrobacter sp. TaxID=1042 RepID=UPI0025F4CB44|nr:glycosyl hydrolase [Erythrobacter sp.]